MNKLVKIHSLCYNIGMNLVQMRTTYPEDRFLMPSLFIGAIIFAVGILVALTISILYTIKKYRVKTVETPKRIESKPEFYVEMGNHKIPVEEDEIKSLRRRNYKVVQK
jgi:hypothetical protein